MKDYYYQSFECCLSDNYPLSFLINETDFLREAEIVHMFLKEVTPDGCECLIIFKVPRDYGEA